MEFAQRFHHELLDIHLSKLRPDDLAILAAAEQTGDIDVLTRWYWGSEEHPEGWAMLPALKPLYYAPHPNQFWLGSWASGKTSNRAGMGFIRCLSKSYYKFLNLAPVGRQAELMYKFLRNEVTNNLRLAHLVERPREKPWPLIRFWNGSTMEFLTAKPEYLDYLQGEEFDEGNIDEGALIINFGRVVGLFRSRLRGIRQRTGRPRLCLLTVTTVPGVDSDLKERYDRGLKDNPDYISLKITAKHNPYVTPEQLRLMAQDIPPEDIPIYLDCEWPEVRGRILPAVHYDACEDQDMMVQMDELIKEGVAGANYQELDRVGCIRWELPWEEGHIYVVVGDPGSGNPPRRGAGVVMAWDVTEDPVELVYFDWVYGNDSIGPWVASFKYAIEKYPGSKGFDTTGAQKFMDQMVFEREGIIVEPLNFSRDKFGFLNALRLMLESHSMRFPFIEGMKSQARKYDLPDEKLAQDIVATLMMSAWMIRPSRVYSEPTQDRLPYLWAVRGTRGTRGIVRSPR